MFKWLCSTLRYRDLAQAAPGTATSSYKTPPLPGLPRRIGRQLTRRPRVPTGRSTLC